MRTNSTRTFGVELEIAGCEDLSLSGVGVAAKLTEAGILCSYAGYDHHTSRTWKIVSDSSIHTRNGFELVSPPLSGNEGLEEIRKVCRVLKTLGAKVNEQCGLHVHHNARDLSISNWKTLFKQYLKHEAVADSFMSPSRRENVNQYCHSLRAVFNPYRGVYSTGFDLTESFRKIDACTDIQSLSDLFQTRYVKVNLQSFFRHGTVEFRQHQGTVNADKIVAWVVLTQSIVDASFQWSRINVAGQDSFDNFLSAVPAETRHDVKIFFRRRQRELGNRTNRRAQTA